MTRNDIVFFIANVSPLVRQFAPVCIYFWREKKKRLKIKGSKNECQQIPIEEQSVISKTSHSVILSAIIILKVCASLWWEETQREKKKHFQVNNFTFTLHSSIDWKMFHSKNHGIRLRFRPSQYFILRRRKNEKLVL